MCEICVSKVILAAKKKKKTVTLCEIVLFGIVFLVFSALATRILSYIMTLIFFHVEIYIELHS